MSTLPLEIFQYTLNIPDIALLPVSIIAVVFVLTIHKFTKAFVAVKCGDLTPKINGRYTINPLKHSDIIGLASFAILGIGWSKPLPINPNNFKKRNTGIALTSISGILSNILTAVLIWPLYVLATNFIPLNYFSLQLYALLWFLFLYSLSYAAFNLIPLPPLDAWQLIELLARKRGKFYQFFKNNGYIILNCLIIYHFIVLTIHKYTPNYARYLKYVDLLQYFYEYIINGISMSIQKVWGQIFSLWR